jgi:hypothetical protein
LESLELLRDAGIECRGPLGYLGRENEFEAAAIVSQGCKTVIDGQDECTTYWFVRHGIYDYAMDVIGGICVSRALGC